MSLEMNRLWDSLAERENTWMQLVSFTVVADVTQGTTDTIGTEIETKSRAEIMGGTMAGESAPDGMPEISTIAAEAAVEIGAFETDAVDDLTAPL